MDERQAVHMKVLTVEGEGGSMVAVAIDAK